MRKKILSIILFLFTLIVNGQTNLIPNGDFESYKVCPEFLTWDSYEIENILENWKTLFPDMPVNILNTPEYFNSCAINTTQHVPENILGYQNAESGNGYIGIHYSYDTSSFPSEKKEYIFTELTMPLIADQTYTFSMFISLADSANFATNKLGAAFVTSLPYYNNSAIIPLENYGIVPQVSSNSVIIDKENWSKVTGTFTALGGEKYIIIGSFHNRENLHAIDLRNDNNNDDLFFSTYYYIDSVSLVETSASSPSFDKNTISIYPNPSSGVIYIKGLENINETKISLFDINGRRVPAKIQDNIVNLERLDNGVYILKIAFSEKEYIQKKIIKK